MKFKGLNIDENGKISGSLKTLVNGMEISIPVNTSMHELKLREENKKDPESREKQVIEEDEIIVPINTFQVNSIAGTELGKKLFRIYIRARSNNFNNVVLKKTDYKDFLKLKAARESEDYGLNNTARLNNEGIAFEKSGKIEQAINIYESNIKIGYPATHSYERLMILYHKRKDFENEKRVIEIAIQVFTKENQDRAERAIQNHPHLSDKIGKELLFCNKVMGDNGFYCFVPYDVLKYKRRLLKLVQTDSKNLNDEN
jgi:hypothetical protein